MKHKRKIIGLMLTFGFIVLIFDSELAFQGANEGITLCLQTIVPSLFPFFLLSAALNGILGNSSFKGANFIAGRLPASIGGSAPVDSCFFGRLSCGCEICC